MADTTASQPVELRPGIFQFAGQKPASHSYLILGGAKSVLIDPGLPAGTEHLRSCLGELGLEPKDVDLVVLTHEHMDHVGCAPLFSPTALVAAHALAANKIVLQDDFVMLGRAFDLETHSFRVDVCFEGECTLELGDYRLRILHTPGHTSGSICLYEPDHRLLFTGDTVMAGGMMGGIFGSGNISDYIATLKRLATLRVDEFYPGHGRLSTDPTADMEVAAERSVTLMEDSRSLFEAIGAKKNYAYIFRYARNINK